MGLLEMGDRIKRLERCFLNFIALYTGELQAVTTPDELRQVQELLGSELEAMKDDM